MAISKPAYGGEDGSTFGNAGRQESPPKRLSGLPVPPSVTPTFRPPRRKTVHLYKCSSREWTEAQTDRLDIRTAADMTRREVNSREHFFDSSLDSGTSLTLQRLQVLFHSLSKVLFIFRSRYLCAIGLSKIFSLGRGIPAIRTAFPSSTTPKVPRCCFAQRWENGAITL